ncbi:LysR family transcriptional regulator [Facilibium subflavum]|uniref:LysR family transcriptional regulator n=1 Tax=Facilibium subflavum TaxID=2219058 RepID=UPI000E64F03D|nr:LysR family transcriptional regulator [Facilibium subflavum]
MEALNKKWLDVIYQVSLKDLYVFCTLYETRSYAQTTQSLNMYAHTCKRIITKLEELTCTKLIQTTQQGIRPTPTADIIYPKAKAFLLQADDDISKFTQENKLKLFLDIYSATVLTQSPLFKTLNTQGYSMEINTYAQVVLQEYGLIVKQYINSYNIVILRNEFEHLIDPSLWLIKHRKKSSLKLYASKEYIKTHGMPKKPADLQNHSCLLSKFTEEKSLSLTHKTTGEKSTVELKGKFSFDAFIIKYIAIVRNVGIGVLLDDIVEYLQLKDLEVILPDYEIGDMDRVLYVRKDQKHPLLNNLVDFLKTNL